MWPRAFIKRLYLDASLIPIDQNEIRLNQNDTQVIHINEVTQQDPNQLLISSVFDWSVVVLSLAVLIYGLTSWCLIQKFRHFRNYVYLNAILACVCRLITFSIIYRVFGYSADGGPVPDTIDFFLKYFTSVQCYWFLVMCCILYVDIVKVFNGDIQRRFLKSTLFAWGVPLVSTVICKFVLPLFLSDDMFFYPQTVIVNLPLFVNLIIYMKFIHSLFCCWYGSSENSNSATNCLRRFYIASLIFIFSDIAMLFTVVMTKTLKLSLITQSVLSDIQVISIDLFVPLIRCNRDLWKAFRAKRLERNVFLTV